MKMIHLVFQERKTETNLKGLSLRDPIRIQKDIAIHGVTNYIEGYYSLSLNCISLFPITKLGDRSKTFLILWHVFLIIHASFFARREY